MNHLRRTLGLAFLFSLKINLLACSVLTVYCVCVSVCSHSRVDLQDEVFLLFELWDGLQHVAHGQDSAAIRPAVLNMRRTFLTVVQQHTTCNRKCVSTDFIQDSRIIPSCVSGSSRTCSDDLGDDVQISLHVFVAQVLKSPRGRENSKFRKQRGWYAANFKLYVQTGCRFLRTDDQGCHNISCHVKVCCFLLVSCAWISRCSRSWRSSWSPEPGASHLWTHFLRWYFCSGFNDSGIRIQTDF